MKSIFLKWHLGLGDAIICNGLVRRAAKSGWDKVILPAKPHNFDTVKWMFSDEPIISVIEVDGDEEMQRIGKFGCWTGIGLWSQRGLQPKKWDRGFYEDAGVPFECRWSEFKLPPIDETVCHRHPRWFIHDDPSRRYVICTTKVPGDYRPDPSAPFADHVLPLKAAQEIHVIDSCFLALADSIATKAKRHVLHLYATAHDPYKKFGPPTLKKTWEILR